MITCVDDFPLPPQGFAVKWKKCRECGEVYRYIYQPYSWANPILTTPCGHFLGRRDLNCDTISEREADEFFRLRSGNMKKIALKKRPKKVKKPTKVKRREP